MRMLFFSSARASLRRPHVRGNGPAVGKMPTIGDYEGRSWCRASAVHGMGLSWSYCVRAQKHTLIQGGTRQNVFRSAAPLGAVINCL
jgi:hypothetical protein